MVGPARVDFIADILVTDVGRKPHSAPGVAVVGRCVNHVRAMHHHIARFIVGGEPARAGSFGERFEVLSQPALVQILL